MPRRTPRSPAVLLLPAGLLVAAASARAQPSTSADSFPARPGRWALEAGVNGGLTNLGALRFTGARTAVGFNVFGNYSTRRAEDDDLGPFGSEFTYTNVGTSLGVRRYASMRGPVAAFGTLGAVANFFRTGSDGSSQRQAGVCGFGELGASYVVARRLGLNAFTRAQVTRDFGRTTGRTVIGGDQLVNAVQRTRGWSVSAGGVGLSATLFF